MYNDIVHRRCASTQVRAAAACDVFVVINIIALTCMNWNFQDSTTYSVTPLTTLDTVPNTSGTHVDVRNSIVTQAVKAHLQP
jgi:hypothetical protein